MVGVAQLVELRIVIPAVEGSNPFVHPNFLCLLRIPQVSLLCSEADASSERSAEKAIRPGHKALRVAPVRALVISCSGLKKLFLP